MLPFSSPGCGGGSSLAEPNLDGSSASSSAAAGSIWSPGADRFHLSLLTELIWHREIIEEFAMSVVNDMDLNMEKREILHLGIHNGGEENGGSPNISSYSVREMHYRANKAL